MQTSKHWRATEICGLLPPRGSSKSPHVVYVSGIDFITLEENCNKASEIITKGSIKSLPNVESESRLD